jgi:hypothetical protein
MKGAARLDKVVRKCIAKERKQRYDTVAEMQKELIPAMPALPGDCYSSLPIHAIDDKVKG